MKNLADKDGNIAADAPLRELVYAKNQSKIAFKALACTGGVAVPLIGSMFVAGFAAARIAKDTVVDQATGIATVKGGSGTVMKTSEATELWKGVHPGMMNSKSLSLLKTVDFASNGGSASFQVKGFSTVSDENMILVEGGNLIYDSDGLSGANGNALAILKNAFGDSFTENGGDERRLGAKKKIKTHFVRLRSDRESVHVAFQRLDGGNGNGNSKLRIGRITFSELKKATRNAGLKLTDEEIQKMIDDADTTGDGAINEEEFFGALGLVYYGRS